MSEAAPELRESNRDLLPALESALRDGRKEAAADVIDQLHAADAAVLFAQLPDDLRPAFLRLCGSREIAALVAHLGDSEKPRAVAMLGAGQQMDVFTALPDDELADLLQNMDPGARERALRRLPDSKKRIARILLNYPEDTAGGRMTTALAAVQPDMTIREAIAQLRERAESTEVLSRIFVIDPHGRLAGKVRLRDLAFNPRSLTVSDIMHPETIAIEATADQEEAVRLMSRYDMMALPVLDADGRLVGVITHDDAMEIQEEESTEDLERQSAISGAPADSDYLATSVIHHWRRRFGWILVLAALAITSGLVIFRYEDVLTRYYILAIYMPMVVAAGGNTGAQAATMVIRAMSLDEFRPSAFLLVAWKEMRIGILIGGLLGACVAAQIAFFMPFDTELPAGVGFGRIALAVGLALTFQITTSTLAGAALPILAKTLRLDPAVVASPTITTIVDVTGLLIYFGLASALLGI